MNAYAQPGGKYSTVLTLASRRSLHLPGTFKTNSGVIFQYALVGDTSFGRGFISPTSEAVNFYTQEITELDDEGKEVVVDSWEIAVWC